jgi:hypothetical protein
MFARLLFSFFVLTMLTIPCLAQPQDSGSAKPASTPPANAQANPPADKTPAPPEKRKPRKVWTNEDMGSIKGEISVVGEPDPPSEIAVPVIPPDANRSRQMLIENYRKQVQQYQAQIDAAGKRIAQLKSFKGENTAPSGGININQGYRMIPLEDQVKQLEERKKQLQAKIEGVENDARKNGIESGDLR